MVSLDRLLKSSKSFVFGFGALCALGVYVGISKGQPYYLWVQHAMELGVVGIALGYRAYKTWTQAPDIVVPHRELAEEIKFSSEKGEALKKTIEDKMKALFAKYPGEQDIILSARIHGETAVDIALDRNQPKLAESMIESAHPRIKPLAETLPQMSGDILKLILNYENATNLDQYVSTPEHRQWMYDKYKLDRGLNKAEIKAESEAEQVSQNNHSVNHSKKQRKSKR